MVNQLEEEKYDNKRWWQFGFKWWYGNKTKCKESEFTTDTTCWIKEDSFLNSLLEIVHEETCKSSKNK